jgi:N-acetyl-gamma-glutamyl-phosphate reductase
MISVVFAGRSAKEANLYTEIAEGIHAYGITRHRHVPEIEQGLTDAVGSEVTVSFTPNLMPMSRGMMSTMFVVMKAGVSVDDLHQHLVHRYHVSSFALFLYDVLCGTCS